MCGIAGIIAGDSGLVQRALPAMDTAQRHRGPDGHGMLIQAVGDVTVGLAHRRLAILDLSPLAAQPMVHPATGDAIVFNGEIYNFRALRQELAQEGERFSSSGDTEVLLRGLSRHGENFIKRLQGMFAFGFLCRRTRRLLLARDPMGIKPLYYAAGGGQFVFASEVRAIVSTGLVETAIDQAAVGEYLSFGSFQQPSTIFQDVRMLMPGHLAWVECQATRMMPAVQYWHFPDVDPEMAESEAFDGLRDLLGAAVRDHLESDVPVGVFLSSGIDSTILAGLAKEYSNHVRSFTVGFDDHNEFSEAAVAAETADLFGLKHTPIIVNSAAAPAIAAEWLASLDQPSIDGLNTFLISKVVGEHGISVALSGLGGDEVFGGYPSFIDVPFFAKSLGMIKWAPDALRGVLARTLSVRRSLAYQQKLRSILCSDGTIEALYLLRRRALSDEQLHSLGIDPMFVATEAVLSPSVRDVVRMVPDTIAAVSRLESMLYQGNTTLRDSDTNGMAHGLEIRVPLLDRRVVEFMSRVPGRLRLPRDSAPKHLLRKACADLLRPRVCDQRKMGFNLPLRQWMAGSLRDICEDAIEHLATCGFVDPRGVRMIWNSYVQAPETSTWTRALSLVVLGHYLKHSASRISAGGGHARIPPLP